MRTGIGFAAAGGPVELKLMKAFAGKHAPSIQHAGVTSLEARCGGFYPLRGTRRPKILA